MRLGAIALRFRRARAGVIAVGASAVAAAGLVVTGLSLAATASAARYPRCHSTQLAVRIWREGAALGHIGVEVRFVNLSGGACSLYGYPGLQMLDGRNHALPTRVHRGVAYTVPKTAERVVIVRPRASAAFDAGWDDATGYGLKKCPTSSRVLVTPPDAYRSISVRWRIQPYGGGTIQHLRCGQITVSPVFAPTSHATA